MKLAMKSLLLLALARLAIGQEVQEVLPPPLTSENNNTIDIYNLHIESHIRLRFATTRVVSRVANRHSVAKEVKFVMQLPPEAFISNFSMIIDGKLRQGVVMEKKKAAKVYQRARSRGQSAGHVAARARNANSFKIEVNVAAHSTVVFILNYDEMLQRSLGVYEHQININPGQIVEDLRVRVFINETRPLELLQVPAFRENFDYGTGTEQQENDLAHVERDGPHTAAVYYEPTMEEQAKISGRGLVGQFRVRYDLERDLSKPDVEVVNGYFVHSFVPDEVQTTVLPKAITFILDKSGSMYGRKMRQMLAAMVSILSDLQPEDVFTIIMFSSTYQLLEYKTPVTASSIAAAQEKVRAQTAGGSTNIYDAVRTGLRISKDEVNSTTHVPIMILLTDGQPNGGTGGQIQILRYLKMHNTDSKIPVFGIGFGSPGSGLDYDFINDVSLKNYAVARRIYEDSDAVVQIHDFYRGLSTPLLRDVKFRYAVEDMEELTETSFRHFYSGTEMIFAGKIFDNIDLPVEIQITASGAEGSFEKNYTLPRNNYVQEASDGSHIANVIEKMWAYLTIKQTLRQREVTEDRSRKDQLTSKALAMALRYQFVTPLTSMVVTEDLDDVTTTTTTTTRRPVSSGAAGSIASSPRQSSPALASRATSSADSDPHMFAFVDTVPICFNLYGRDGDRYLLFSDQQNDIQVMGQLMSRPDHKTETFFTTISIKTNGQQLKFRANAQDPLKPEVSCTTDCSTSYNLIFHKQLTIIAFSSGLNVSLHWETKSFVGKRYPFLGVYVTSSFAYREVCTPHRFGGVLGQFYCERAAIQEVMALPHDVQHLLPHAHDSAILSVTDPRGVTRQAYVGAGSRMDFRVHEWHECWFIHNQAMEVMSFPLHEFKLETRKTRLSKHLSHKL